MHWIILIFVMLPLNELVLAQIKKPLNNGTENANISMGGRYIIQNTFFNESNRVEENVMQNGSKLSQNIKTVQVIETTIDVPDDENYVASIIVYNVYKVFNQIIGKETRRETNRDMLQRILSFLKKKLENNYNLTKSFNEILQHFMKIMENILRRQKSITDIRLKIFFHNFLKKISTGPHIADSKTITVKQVEEVIIKSVEERETAQDKEYYARKMQYIVSTLLENENNITIVNAIPSKVARAITMSNIKSSSKIREKIFGMTIRALSLLSYRLKFPKEHSYKSEQEQHQSHEETFVSFNKTDGGTSRKGNIKTLEGETIIKDDDSDFGGPGFQTKIPVQTIIPPCVPFQTTTPVQTIIPPCVPYTKYPNDDKIVAPTIQPPPVKPFPCKKPCPCNCKSNKKHCRLIPAI